MKSSTKGKKNKQKKECTLFRQEKLKGQLAHSDLIKGPDG